MSWLRKAASAALLALLASAMVGAADESRPWTPAELISPAQLNNELADVKAGKVVLIQVGFMMMYKLGHIPGSQYGGPAAKVEGLENLKKVLAKLPRNQRIVIYCGCCPWGDCPNIRPAFHALKEMGFTNFKVLDIPTRLGDDWTAKGYPIVKGD